MESTHQLNWQYVIKKVNATHPTDEKINLLLEGIRSAGSKLGLLPKTISVLSRRDHIDRIFPPDAFPRYSEFSHLFVFSAYSKISHENINELIVHIAACNSLRMDDQEDYKKIMKLLVKVPDESHLKWASRQAYVALGIGITLAAEQDIEVLPIEQFNNEAVDHVLDLKTKNLGSVLILGMGKCDRTSEASRVSDNPKPRRQTSFLVN